MIISSILCWAAISACLWFLWCNDKTLEDRNELLDAIPSGYPRWREVLHEFDTTTYGAHLWARFLFKDWTKLYSDELQSLYTAYVDGR